MIDREPGNAYAYERRGQARSKLGDLDGALQDLNKLLDLDPRNGNRFALRGRAWLEKKDYRNALADFRKALELSPGLKAELAPLADECERNLPGK